jgi:hypothetical protein
LRLSGEIQFGMWLKTVKTSRASSLIARGDDANRELFVVNARKKYVLSVRKKVAISPYKFSEEGMAQEMLPHLVSRMNSFEQVKQIYVYDRGFPSHAFAQRHINLGVDFLFRVQ